ncbi:MAG TPA: PAS domain S-box protein, partial [Puia sp.]|nr:PAS domain S-box protein [Puia sp.]
MKKTNHLIDTLAGAIQKSNHQCADYVNPLEQSAIVAITDQKGIILYASQNFCKISKYTAEELIGKDHCITNSGYHSASFFKNLWATITTGKTWRDDVCNRAKDGSLYWVDTNIVPFLDDWGTPYQYMTIAIDITNRKKAEKTLLKSNELFRKLFDHSPAAFSIRGMHDGKFITVNDNFLKLFGFSSKQDVIGKSPVELKIISSSEESEIRSILRDKEVAKNIERISQTKNGDKIWVSTTLIKLEINNKLCVLAATIDITKQKNEEEHLALLAAIVESSDDAIISKSLDGTISSWNKSAERLFGFTEKEAVGKNISMIIPPECVSDEKIIIEKLCNNEFVNQYETVRNKKNGEHFYVSLTVSPMKNHAGKIIGVSKIARDITSRKKLFDNSPAAFAIRGMNDGKLMNVNDTFLELFGFSSEQDVIGKTCIELKIISASEESEVRSILQEKEVAKNIERISQTKNGDKIWVSTSFSKLEIN